MESPTGKLALAGSECFFEPSRSNFCIFPPGFCLILGLCWATTIFFCSNLEWKMGHLAAWHMNNDLRPCLAKLVWCNLLNAHMLPPTGKLALAGSECFFEPSRSNFCIFPLDSASDLRPWHIFFNTLTHLAYFSMYYLLVWTQHNGAGYPGPAARATGATRCYWTERTLTSRKVSLARWGGHSFVYKWAFNFNMVSLDDRNW